MLESSLRFLFPPLTSDYISTKLTFTLRNCWNVGEISIKALLKEMEAEEAMVNTPAVPWNAGVEQPGLPALL